MLWFVPEKLFFLLSFSLLRWFSDSSFCVFTRTGFKTLRGCISCVLVLSNTLLGAYFHPVTNACFLCLHLLALIQVSLVVWF
jgi:hypothetical protein